MEVFNIIRVILLFTNLFNLPNHLNIIRLILKLKIIWLVKTMLILSISQLLLILNINKLLNLIIMLLLREKVREEIPIIKAFKEPLCMLTCNIPQIRGILLIIMLCIHRCLTLRTGMITFLIILLARRAIAYLPS